MEKLDTQDIINDVQKDSNEYETSLEIELIVNYTDLLSNLNMNYCI